MTQHIEVTPLSAGKIEGQIIRFNTNDFNPIILDGMWDCSDSNQFDLKIAAAKFGFQNIIKQDPESFSNVVVDLDEVENIDVAGLRLIAELADVCDSFGGKLVIVHPSEAVLRLIIDGCIDTIISLATSESEALDLLSR